MEVVYDLDHEAQSLATELGVQLVRSSTAGTNALFARMMGDLVEERLQSEEGMERKAVGHNQAAPDFCKPDCCAYTPVRPGQKATT
jgi:ferrochelatase